MQNTLASFHLNPVSRRPSTLDQLTITGKIPNRSQLSIVSSPGQSANVISVVNSAGSSILALGNDGSLTISANLNMVNTANVGVSGGTQIQFNNSSGNITIERTATLFVHNVGGACNVGIAGGSSSNVPSLRFQNGTGNDRVVLTLTSTAESGTAVGHDFQINTYNNSSILIGTALQITRATGAILLLSQVTQYNNISTTGFGIPAIYGYARPAGAVGAIAAVASVATYTVGAIDGTFLVSANVLLTAATTCNFTVTCAYTDEGNNSRTLTLTFSQVTGVLLTAITNVTGAGAYEGVLLHIRAKASTTITVGTTGTFTSCTYNCEGLITQAA